MHKSISLLVFFLLNPIQAQFNLNINFGSQDALKFDGVFIPKPNLKSPIGFPYTRVRPLRERSGRLTAISRARPIKYK